ncbi:MAG: GntR family transcriptional regulator [Sphingobium sp.]
MTQDLPNPAYPVPLDGTAEDAFSESRGLISLSKVRVKKTAELVATQVRNAIVRGELPAGQVLPTESELVARFETSRPTVREALRILESENLIEVSRGKRAGARVSVPSTGMVARALGLTLQTRRTKLSDIYQARALIEPPAVRLAAETRPLEAGRILLDHVEHERSLTRESGPIAHGVITFHRLLVEQSGNGTVTLIVDALYQLSEKHAMLVYGRRQIEDPISQAKRSELGFKAHQRVAELILAGDGEGAESFWRKHIDRAADVWLRDFRDSTIDILD